MLENNLAIEYITSGYYVRKLLDEKNTRIFGYFPENNESARRMRAHRRGEIVKASKDQRLYFVVLFDPNGILEDEPVFYSESETECQAFIDRKNERQNRMNDDYYFLANLRQENNNLKAQLWKYEKGLEFSNWAKQQ